MVWRSRPRRETSVPAQEPLAKARRGERGLILVYVSVLGFLMMLVWSLSWRATHDAIRVERSLTWRDTHDTSVTRAAAIGLELLETGFPPTEDYTCIVTIVDGADVYECLLEYSIVTWPWRRGLDVRLATDAEVAIYPAAPVTF